MCKRTAFSYIIPVSKHARFKSGTILGVVRDAKIAEASGYAATCSRTHPGLLYTLNDSGGENEIYVLATNGTLVATYDIKGSDNKDWEDLAVGPCDSGSIVHIVFISISEITYMYISSAQGRNLQWDHVIPVVTVRSVFTSVSEITNISSA